MYKHCNYLTLVFDFVAVIYMHGTYHFFVSFFVKRFCKKIKKILNEIFICYGVIVLYLIVIAFAIFSHFQTHFLAFLRNKHNNPIPTIFEF